MSEEGLNELDWLLKELRALNEHLADFKIMLAPYLGYVIKETPPHANQ